MQAKYHAAGDDYTEQQTVESSIICQRLAAYTTSRLPLPLPRPLGPCIIALFLCEQ